MKITKKQVKGQEGEQIAREYLEQQGLRTQAYNYRACGGEIDLIMADREILVLVEVRYHAKENPRETAESIHWHKRQCLIKAANQYLNSQIPLPSCRFDVITIDRHQNISWLPQAFMIDE